MPALYLLCFGTVLKTRVLLSEAARLGVGGKVRKTPNMSCSLPDYSRSLVVACRESGVSDLSQNTLLSSIISAMYTATVG